MLLNDFYTLESFQKNDNTISAVLAFNKQHDIFKGHFPQMPVVPGVCTVKSVNELLNKALEKELFLQSASQIKFLSFVNPLHTPQLTMDISFTAAENENIHVTAKAHSDSIIYFKFNGIFK
jgi:3-hydroxyacyl-[acyl-carrier-protein] dehydratase